MKFLTPIFLCAILASCTHSGSSSSQTGGQDGGGGLGGSSTAEQVKATILIAYDLARKPDYYANIYARFWLAQNGGVWVEGNKLRPYPIFPSLNPRVSAAETRWFENKEFASPPLDALLSKPPRLLASGDCQQGTRPHADASTSTFTTEGEVCFSVGNLMRFPPGALLGEILALMLHETIHLAGVRSEAEAEEWQNAFKEFYVWRFGAAGNEQIGQTTRDQLTMANNYLDFAMRANRQHPGDPTAFTVVGAFGRMIITLPHSLDPNLLNLALSPKNPELVNNYSNAVLALYETAKMKFMNPDANAEFKLRPHVIDVSLQLLACQLKIVRDNFAAYTDGSAKSVCLLTQNDDLPWEISGERNGSARNGDSYYNNVKPPHECSPGTMLAADPCSVLAH